MAARREDRGRPDGGRRARGRQLPPRSAHLRLPVHAGRRRADRGRLQGTREPRRARHLRRARRGHRELEGAWTGVHRRRCPHVPFSYTPLHPQPKVYFQYKQTILPYKSFKMFKTLQFVTKKQYKKA